MGSFDFSSVNLSKTYREEEARAAAKGLLPGSLKFMAVVMRRVSKRVSQGRIAR